MGSGKEVSEGRNWSCKCRQLWGSRAVKQGTHQLQGATTLLYLTFLLSPSILTPAQRTAVCQVAMLAQPVLTKGLIMCARWACMSIPKPLLHKPCMFVCGVGRRLRRAGWQEGAGWWGGGMDRTALDSPASILQTPLPVKSLLCTFASPLLFTANALHPSLCLLKLILSKFDSTRQPFLRQVCSISLYLFIL